MALACVRVVSQEKRSRVDEPQVAAAGQVGGDTRCGSQWTGLAHSQGRPPSAPALYQGAGVVQEVPCELVEGLKSQMKGLEERLRKLEGSQPQVGVCEALPRA